MKKINKNILFSLLIIFTTKIIISKDLFEDYYPKAEEILKNMTRNEKIGQIFLPAYTLSTADELIKKYSPGGFVVFEYSIQNHTEEQLINEFQQRKNISKIPLIFSVDEEGGTVQRIGPHFYNNSYFPSPRESFLKNGIEEILNIEKQKINLLKKLNFNVNLAPVADMSQNESDYIYKRTLGENVTLTTEYITKEVTTYVENNFSCCLKHFPGYGNNINTHEDVAHDYRSKEQIEKNDLVPFIKSIDKNVPMIMFSHNIVHCYDENFPASLSKKLHDILRDDNKYSGLILTDSLSMGAITKYTQNISAAVLAVKAGNDLLITSTFEKHIEDLIKAVDNKEVDMELIEKACKRVLAWKLKYLSEQFEEEKDEEEKKNDKSSGVMLFVFIGISVVLLLVLLVLVVFNFCKKKRNVEKEIKGGEYLLGEGNVEEN